MEGRESSQILQRVDRLHTLVREDNKAAIAALLKEDQTADIVDRKLSGKTALHVAASLGHSEVVELLVRVGNADIHAQTDDCKDTPLHLAAVFGHEAVVDKLLELGAVSDIRTEDRNGDKPVHNAARSGKEKIIKRLLSVAPNRDACILAKNGKLRTVLHYAAGSGNHKAVALLLEAKQDLKEVRDRHKALPFHFAAGSGDVKSVQMLVPNDVNDADEDGLTALDYAARNGNVDVVKWLLVNGATLREGSRTPLHLAAVSKKPQRVGVVEAIMASHPGSWKSENKNGELAIGLAHERGHGDVVKAFLRALRKSMSLAGYEILTPKHGTSEATLLHFAAAHGTRDDIDWLAPAVAKGQKTVNDFVDKSGRAPLHWAALKGNKNTLRALAAHGADLNLVGNKGAHETPLFLALGEGHLVFAEELLKCDKEITKNHLLTTDEWMEGVDRWLMSYYGAKVELRAVKEELERDFKRLTTSRNTTWLSTSNGGAINILYEEIPPVYLALHAKKLDIAKFFQRLSSYEDAVNKTGKYTRRTALHWAVLLRRRDIVEQLCNEEPFKEKVRACDVDAQGISPVQYATERNMQDIESVLFKREAVKNYIDGLYRDRQIYVDSTNAILVGAALIASVTFAGWLQPPLGFADHHYDADLPYVAIRRVHGMRIFWIFNSLSFFAAMATVQAGACGVLPLAHVHIGRAVNYIRRALMVASILMALSVVCVLCAFGAAGFVVLPPRFKFQFYMMATVMFGGLINAFLVLWFIQRVLIAPRLLLVWRRHLFGGPDSKRSAPPPDLAGPAGKAAIESPQQGSTPRPSVDIRKPSFPWDDGIEDERERYM